MQLNAIQRMQPIYFHRTVINSIFNFIQIATNTGTYFLQHSWLLNSFKSQHFPEQKHTDQHVRIQYWQHHTKRISNLNDFWACIWQWQFKFRENLTYLNVKLDMLDDVPVLISAMTIWFLLGMRYWMLTRFLHTSKTCIECHNLFNKSNV